MSSGSHPQDYHGNVVEDPRKRHVHLIAQSITNSTVCKMISKGELLFFFILLIRCWPLLASTPQGRDFNPYRVLNVSKDATKNEIRQSYRSLCLKYHPDKNVNRSGAEKRASEERFKQIQKAYALVGDIEARKQYDFHSRFSSNAFPPSRNRKSSSPYGAFTADSSYEDVMRAFKAQFSARPRTSQSHPFDRFSANTLFTRSPFGSAGLNGSSLKSVYLQKFKVSLRDLYTGQIAVELKLRDDPWQRYTAAFRGGVGFILLYQSALYSLPWLRLSKFVSAALGAFLFNANLPRPPLARIYRANLLAGYKGGTRLIFRDAAPGIEVVFEVSEALDPHYTRVDNDLHVTVALTPDEATEGCTVEIASLDPSEPAMELEFSGSVSNGQIVTISGRGWPMRKSNSAGDLLVHVQICRRKQRRQSRRQFLQKH